MKRSVYFVARIMALLKPAYPLPRLFEARSARSLLGGVGGNQIRCPCFPRARRVKLTLLDLCKCQLVSEDDDMKHLKQCIGSRLTFTIEFLIITKE